MTRFAFRPFREQNWRIWAEPPVLIFPKRGAFPGRTQIRFRHPFRQILCLARRWRVRQFRGRGGAVVTGTRVRHSRLIEGRRIPNAQGSNRYYGSAVSRIVLHVAYLDDDRRTGLDAVLERDVDLPTSPKRVCAHPDGHGYSPLGVLESRPSRNSSENARRAKRRFRTL